MGRRYMTIQVDGEEPLRRLAFIECDRCDARIEPNPDIAHSGWVKEGIYYGPGDGRNHETDLCPGCR